MNKILTILLLLGLIPTAFLSAEDYLASAGFSGTQGENGWHYFESDGESLTELSYDAATKQWLGSNSFIFVSSNQSRPNPGINVIRAWIVPSNGTVNISGSVNRPGRWGDGVAASIVLNSDELWSATLAPEERATPEGLEDIEVNAGDVIYFIVDALESRASDHTLWDPNIAFTPNPTGIYRASAGFSDTQGKNGWYYLESDGNNYSNLTYNRDLNRWEGSNSIVRIWVSASFPIVGLSPVRAWVAPANGSLTITGEVNRSNTSGDGVTASILLNSIELWSANIPAGAQTTPNGVKDVKVQKGDTIYFSVNANANFTADLTRWNPVIDFVEGTGEELGPNLITDNSDFSSGMEKWATWVNRNQGVSADIRTVNGELRVDNIVTSPNGTRGNHIRVFYDSPVTLEQGKYYTISVDAKVDPSSPAKQLAFGMVHGGNLNYGSYDMIERTVSNEMNTYSFVYSHVGPTDQAGQFIMYMGFDETPITIDNISIREGGKPYANLPEILVTNDGQKVQDIETWENTRKNEILDVYKKEVYGLYPEPGEYNSSSRVLSTDDIANGTAVRKIVRISVEGPNGTHTYNSYVYLPKSSTPVPVVILINHRGAVRGTSSTSGYFPLNNIILPRGYGAAVLNVDDVAPDDRREWNSKLISMFNKNGENDWRCLSAWTFSVSRIIDYLVTDPGVDASKIAVIGHSRSGKASLWAGAQDSRIALTISNNSGAIGSKLLRHTSYQGQTIEGASRIFDRWFALKLASYSYQDEKIPFDAHQLVSTIAPRLIAIGSASGDLNADPVGEFHSLVLSQPAFELYGVTDKTWMLTDGPYDNNNHTVLENGNLHHHRRSGSHDLNAYDWRQYLDFADKHWK